MQNSTVWIRADRQKKEKEIKRGSAEKSVLPFLFCQAMNTWEFTRDHEKNMEKIFSFTIFFRDFRKLYMDSKENDLERAEIKKK